MIINHNLNAMGAHRNMAFNTSQTGKAMEKLSSGLRINRAGDDAAGLAISEKMRGQIRGLDQATRNSQDGISLIQTAEGALNETHNILQRMRELSVQGSNDTMTDDDRGKIQSEMDQLTKEVDRIAGTTEFNTQRLLRGKEGTTNFSDMKAVQENLQGGIDKNHTNMSSTSLVLSEKATNLKDGSQISITADGTTYKFEFDTDTNAVEAGATRVAVGGSIDASMNNLVSEMNNTAEFKDNFVASYDTTTNSLKITAKETGEFAGSDGNAVTINSTTAGISGNGLQREENVAMNGTGTSTTFSQEQLSMQISDGATIVVDGTTYEFDKDSNADPSRTAVSLGANDTLEDALTALASQLGGIASFNATTGILVTDGAGASAMSAKVHGDAWVGTPQANFAGGVTTAGAQATKRVTLESVPEAGTELKTGDLTFKFYNSDQSSYAETLKDKEFGIDVKGKTIEQVRDAIVAAYTSADAEEKTQVTISANSTNKLDITSVDYGEAGNDLKVELGGTGNAFTDVELKFQIGANENQSVNINLSTMDSGSLGVGRRADGSNNINGEDAVKGLDISSHEKAKEAITIIDSAIQTVSEERSKLGAFQNRLEHTINNLSTSSENLTAAESRIRDVDMAKEMMNFTKNNILNQAAQAMMSQANQQPQAVLQLLR